MPVLQLKWLVDSLPFESEGWSVIFMSHDFLYPISEAEGKVSNGNLAWEIICAFKNGLKRTVKNDDRYYSANVSYDFTYNKSNDVLAYMFGHIHKDTDFVKDGITAISTINVLNADNEWDNEDSRILGGWDFITIDKKMRIFKSKRYGVSDAEREICL